MTQEAVRKYEVVEDLPGVGPSTVEKLKELDFHTIESLATGTVKRGGWMREACRFIKNKHTIQKGRCHWQSQERRRPQKWHETPPKHKLTKPPTSYYSRRKQHNAPNPKHAPASPSPR